MLWTLLFATLVSAVDLPMGAAPEALPVEHFPSRLHAFVWRNWELVPAQRLAEVVETEPRNILDIGRSMGLEGPPDITLDQRKRSYITVIRRNWHLLPYDQLLVLLDWTPEEMAYCLREDDFFYVKVGLLKPKCERLVYAPPSETEKARAAEISQVLREEFPGGVGVPKEPLFAFVKELSKPSSAAGGTPQATPAAGESLFSPRYCYSYFALYGDPLLEEDLDPYPDGLLEKLAQSGVSGVWLQGVVFKLAPFPWEPSLSEGSETRLANLRKLVERAGRYGIGVYLYLNEPRSMPLAFFEKHPDLKGVLEGDYAAMCTSVTEVQDYLRSSVRSISQAVPGLAGFFTITGSENLTNCWSHHQGMNCPHCAPRGPATVISEVNALIAEGLEAAGNGARLIAWDWGWQDEWAPEAIRKLPPSVSLMSVSEWSIPIQRGGIDSVIGEYSISEIGPGPRATRHWAVARESGLKTLAKIQAGTTWEIGSVPYVPAVENVARHAGNLRHAHLDGLMLGWTLGGYPSPNLEVVAAMGSSLDLTPDQAMLRVAERRFGEALAPAVVEAWKAYSQAFSEYPYHIGTVYSGPQHMGPANLLWQAPTGYQATMVGLPYDDLPSWRSVYPPEVFSAQFETMAEGFSQALLALRSQAGKLTLTEDQSAALQAECNIAEVCSIHFRSVANQTRFVVARDELASATETAVRTELNARLENALQSEIDLAKRLHAIQTADSRIGFEATNQYFYVPVDLAEKVINCRYLKRAISLP